MVMPVVNCHAHFLLLSSITPTQNPNFTTTDLKLASPVQNLTPALPLPAKISSRRRGRLAVAASPKDNDKITAPEGEVESFGVKAALSALRFYKREISPLLPKSCRYVPSCSEYSMEAYKKYGVVKGSILTAWRLCRCNPLGGSGFDPPRWFDEPSPAED